MSASLLPSLDLFASAAPLVTGRAVGRCRACVVIPVRNEEAELAACLDALREQRDLSGQRFAPSCFEVLLLVNNSTDDSIGVARRWQRANSRITLHIIERIFLSEEAHVGTARRLLMDTAWHRLEGAREQPCAILSTDGDSTVAPDWIAQTLLALERGADAVGGLIAIREGELAAMPAQVRQCYERDRRYAELIAELEHRLDPQPGDPWPRHLDHFGSSLACTPEAYVAAGGMPAVSPLEDEAFVDRVRRADLCLRHEPAVRVFTSARLHGRAAMGLAGQLRQWSQLPGESAHQVPSAAFLAHRFRTLHLLRKVFHTGEPCGALAVSDESQRRVRASRQTAVNLPNFLAAIDCDLLIEQSFEGQREESIGVTLLALRAMLAELPAGCSNVDHYSRSSTVSR